MGTNNHPGLFSWQNRCVHVASAASCYRMTINKYCGLRSKTALPPHDARTTDMDAFCTTPPLANTLRSYLTCPRHRVGYLFTTCYAPTVQHTPDACYRLPSPSPPGGLPTAVFARAFASTLWPRHCRLPTCLPYPHYPSPPPPVPAPTLPLPIPRALPPLRTTPRHTHCACHHHAACGHLFA